MMHVVLSLPIGNHQQTQHLATLCMRKLNFTILV